MTPHRRLRDLASAIWPPLPVWKRLDAAVMSMVVYSVAVGIAFELTGLHVPNWGAMLTLLNAVVLGVLLQFRNRESYDRWWEGRRLWGQLVNDARNLFVKSAAMPGLSAGNRGELGGLIVGFADSLRDQLKGAAPAVGPLEYARRTMALLHRWRAEGKLTDWDLLLLDPHARGQSDVMGACERIKNTPLPLSYRSLLRHGLVLYLLICPWLIFDDIGWWGLPAIGLLTYFLLGIELTAEDVEDPFGHDADDLALGNFCETIRKSAAEVFSR